MTVPARIEDYALLGDGETAALVSRHGSIDWLCWPRFDSGACFAALLGTADHGHWQIAPAATATAVKRRYRDGTLVLETEYETPDGAVAVIDFMPPRQDASDLVRLVVGRRGRVKMQTELVIRFDYGSAVPWVYRLPDGDLCAVAGPHALRLRTPVTLVGHDLRTSGEFEVVAGERVPFVLTWSASHVTVAPVDPDAALAATESWWHEWLSRGTYRGRDEAIVTRSLMVLKALIYRPTGGIVAAPTTSLPEALGGVRNWDYRYCWLRDSALTLVALLDAGFVDEAAAWRDWLLRAVAGTPEQVQIMYGIAGERRVPEQELAWLPGYEGSRPVRVGNAAATQHQLDIFGEIGDAMYQASLRGMPPSPQGWRVGRALLAYVERHWREPDEGIWEVRSGRRHFVHSKVMAWVAFDRAVRVVERIGGDAPVERWRALRDEIHREICERGWNAERGTFVQSYGGTEVDASLLQLPLFGFLPPDDPRIRGTLRAIEQDLLADGLVLRYRTDAARDGLPPGEGAFLACSFWYADNLLMQGRTAEARALFDRLVGLCNDVGLLAEEYDPRTRRMLGNFPQAFSHVALVNTALNLARLEGAAVRSG